MVLAYSHTSRWFDRHGWPCSQAATSSPSDRSSSDGSRSARSRPRRSCVHPSMSSGVSGIADALGVLIQRSFRERLYGRLTYGIGPGVDARTHLVLSGLARVGSRRAADLAGVIGLDRSGVSRRASAGGSRPGSQGPRSD